MEKERVISSKRRLLEIVEMAHEYGLSVMLCVNGLYYDIEYKNERETK